jgi:hypothetical protein
VLVETGGMPSSHSALLTGTAAGLGWQLGFDDPLFALAAIMGFVVLYDASGVRLAAGLTAARVNSQAPDDSQKPLKENLGQTAGLVAGASLLIDYTLTVSVSVSAVCDRRNEREHPAESARQSASANGAGGKLTSPASGAGGTVPKCRGPSGRPPSPRHGTWREGG